MSKASTPGLGHGDSRSNYEVGFGKPPVEHRFQKGKSGNYNGRPKKVKPDNDNTITMFADVAEILNEKVEVTEHGRKKKITKRKYSVRRYVHKCANSKDPKVLGEFMKFIEKADRAVLEGRGGEPLHIIIEGGLPDDYIDRAGQGGLDELIAAGFLPPGWREEELPRGKSGVPPANDLPDAGDRKK